MYQFKNTRVKLVMLFVLALTAVNCKTNSNKNTEYKISGHIKGLKSDSAYFFILGSKKRESTPVKNESFSFIGKIDTPEMCVIYFDKEDPKSVEIFLENSIITVNGDIDSLKSIQIKGSKANDEYIDYRNYSKQDREEYVALDNQLADAQHNLDYDKADSIELIKKAAAHRILEKTYEYALANRHSPIIPFITLDAVENAPDKILFNKIFDLLDAETKTNHWITYLEEFIAASEKATLGSMAPDFEMVSGEGKKIKLSAYRGKIVLLDFWASWCQPCIKDLPELLDVYTKYRSDKFEIIGFSIDKDKDAWQRLLNNRKLPWPQVVELKGKDGPTPKDYGIIYIPATYLIDKDGKIAGVNFHGKKLTAKIEELLKEN